MIMINDNIDAPNLKKNTFSRMSCVTLVFVALYINYFFAHEDTRERVQTYYDSIGVNDLLSFTEKTLIVCFY